MKENALLSNTPAEMCTVKLAMAQFACATSDVSNTILLKIDTQLL